MIKCYRYIRPRLLPLLACVMLAGCGESTSNPANNTQNLRKLLSIPDNFPEPVFAAQQQPNAVKIELGRFLFYDRNMSFNQTQSCADCHQQDKAFTDGLTTSIGSEGDTHPRNAMSMTNVVYNATNNWANNLITQLHAQSLAVLTNDAPVELGWTTETRIDEITNRFKNVADDPVAGKVDYPALFAEAFPDDPDPVNIFSFTEALAAFGATLISGDSEFDKKSRGEPNAMSEAAIRGEDIFFGERAECFHCHGGFNFSDSVQHAGLKFESRPFHNNGLYNVDADGDGISDGLYPSDNAGLIEFTFKPEDDGKFRAPTLRNIELTGPYMHDGSIETLEDIVAHYERGGRLITIGLNAGDGKLNPNKSSFVSGFVLEPGERMDLVEFLKSLTDMHFVCNPDLSDPFGNIPMHALCP